VKLTLTQQQAATRLDADVCLTSGAGCGKTTVLTARFINALAASDQAQVADLVAITFTEKAARQMRDRIRRACRERLADADPADKGLWNQRLRDLDAARISTIHAFCAALLRQHAVWAAVDPDFTVLTPIEADPLLETAVDEVFRRRLADANDAGIRLLLDHYAFGQLTETVADLAEHKRDWIAHYVGPAAELDPADLVARWRGRSRDELVRIARREITEGALGRALAVLRRHAAADASDLIEQKRRHFVSKADAIEAATDPDEIIRCFGELLEMRGGSGGKKANWDADALAAVKEAMKVGTDVRNESGDLFAQGATVPEVAGHLSAALVGLVQDVAAAYDRLKAARHAMDFKDLELGALRLLEGFPAVRRQVAASASHLLIDEFQDTSWLQIRLAELICREGGGSAPRLLVVGDAKQSIFRFRDAEVEQFERFAATFDPSDRLNLDTSFRSHAGIVSFVNALCGRFGGRLAGQMKALRKERPPKAAVEMLLIRPDDPTGKLSARGGRRVEAAALARRLRVLIEEATPCVWDRAEKAWRGPRAGDVAMLLRASADMDLYADALQDEGIPTYIVAGGGYYGQQEIVDVRNLLAVLTQPADEVALLGMLRGAMFALTDETLYWLCRQPRSRPGELFARLMTAGDIEGPTDQQRERLVFAAETLEHLAGCVDRMTVADLLDEAFSRTGYLAATLALPGGRRRVGNLRWLVQQARAFDAAAGAGGGGLADFAERIVSLVDTEPREEQAAIAAESDDVVRLMTIHGAKGLEFPIVCLPDLNRKPGSRHRTLTRLHPLLGVTVPCRTEQDELQPTLPHQLADHLDKQADDDEERRLLYVAVTRAEDLLILSGTAPVTGKSPLAALDERMELGLGNREHDDDIAYGPKGEAMRLRVIPAALPAAARRPTAPKRPDLFEAGIPQPEKLARFLRGADPAAAAEVLTACRPAAGRPRRVFGAKELALAFSGVRPLPRAGRPVFSGAAPDAMPPALRGQVLHRALQSYRWTGPNEADALVREAAAAMDLAGADTTAALAAELREQIGKLADTELHAAIAGSPKRMAEVRFLLKLGDAQVRGAIDLLYRDAEGGWWVLDYKSDRIDPGRIEAAAQKYALQIQLYALAASRHTGQAPVGAVLYFLHAGVSYRMALSAGDLEVAEEHAVTTIRQLRKLEAGGS
jgi:ATP-dependent helicase/nuclease subunit A